MWCCPENKKGTLNPFSCFAFEKRLWRNLCILFEHKKKQLLLQFHFDRSNGSDEDAVILRPRDSEACAFFDRSLVVITSVFDLVEMALCSDLLWLLEL